MIEAAKKTGRALAVTAAIVGARNAGQVEGVLGAATLRLNAEEIAEIERGSVPAQ